MIPTLYKPFQHWSATGSVYIISDLHLNDSDCKTMDSNWLPADRQMQLLKKTVHKTDTLVLLGDVGDKEVFKVWPLCKKPYIVLILGNHDAPGEFNNDEYFDEVYSGPLFISSKILLSHEPIDYKYGLNIHGHDHAGNKVKNHINLAANVCNYTPASLTKIIKSGVLNRINDIHRDCIDNATARSRKRLKNGKKQTKRD